MGIRFITAGLSIVLSASAQRPPNPGPSGWIVLASPAVGVPLSAEQREERTLLCVDGTERSEVRTAKIFRDSSGKIRVEFLPDGEHGQSAAFVTLIDPATRSVVILLPAERKAFRLTASASAKGVGFAFPGIEGELPVGSPNTRTHDLGSRVLEGIECRGTRTQLTDQRLGSVVSFTERWRSDPLDLTCSIVVVTANGRHSVTLKHLQRGEPDPALFVLPPAYVIEEIRWPPSPL